MTTQIQRRRGTTAQHSTFTGAEAELTVDTTKDTVVVHDGSTVGGRPLLREDQSNLPTSAPTTGIYNASGSLAISTNSVGRLFVDASGNVGIGTSSLTSGAGRTYLTLGGTTLGSIALKNASNAEVLYIQTGSASVDHYMSVAGYQAFWTNNQERLRITSAGLVGVGDSNPGALLSLKDGNVDNVSGSKLRMNLGPNPYWEIQANNGGTAATRKLEFYTSNPSVGSVLTLLQSGAVGVGTTSPGSTLEVNGAVASKIGSTADASVAVINTFASTFLLQQSDKFHIYTGAGQPIVFTNNNSERLRIDSSGRVGIGTSSVQQALHVSQSGGNNFTGIRSQNSNTGTGIAGIEFSSDATYAKAAIGLVRGDANGVGSLVFYNASSTGAADWSTSDARMVIDSQGRVGIGTTSPGAALDVRGGSRFYADSNGLSVDNIGRSADNISIIRFLDNAVSTELGRVAHYGNDLDVRNLTANSLTFGTNNTERARIDSSGRLLVGTSDGSGSVGRIVVQGASNGSATGVLQVAYNGSATTPLSAGTQLGFLRFTDQGSNGNVFAQIQAEVDATTGANDYPGRLVFSTTRDGQSSPSEACRIDSSQRLLVGRTGPDGSALIQAPATSSIPGYCSATGVATAVTHFEFRNSNGLVGTISTNASATAYNTSSDYRLKENVAPVTDGITRLQQLKPSRFSFIADPTKTVDGFLAHEAAEVVPECVTGEKDAVDDDGNPVYQGIDQSKLVPLLTAALQEAVAKIESLETRLTAAGI